MKTSKEMLRDLRKTHCGLEARYARLLVVARAAAVVDDYLDGMMLEEDWDDVWLEVPSRKTFRLLREALAAVEDLL